MFGLSEALTIKHPPRHAGLIVSATNTPHADRFSTQTRVFYTCPIWLTCSPIWVLSMSVTQVSNYRRYVCSGGTDGLVSIWDLYSIDYITEQTEQEITPILKYPASESDCVNAAWWVSFYLCGLWSIWKLILMLPYYGEWDSKSCILSQN